MNITGNPWKIIDEKAIYDNPWIKLTEYNIINPSGGKGIYGKVTFKNIAMGVIALDNDKNTYLVGQYRFVIDAYSWEIPEGGCPIGLNWVEEAQRELLEETGLVASSWEEILRMHLSNSVTDELAIIFLARNLLQKTPNPEETEQLQVKKIPLNDAFQMVNQGIITDAITVAAFQKLELMILKKQVVL